MRRIQQFVVLESAQSTLMPISFEDTFAECTLMESAAGERRNVFPTNLASLAHARRMRQANMGSIVDGHREGKCVGALCYDEDGPGGDILPWEDAVKVNERQSFLHREAKPLDDIG